MHSVQAIFRHLMLRFKNVVYVRVIDFVWWQQIKRWKPMTDTTTCRERRLRCLETSGQPIPPKFSKLETS